MPVLINHENTLTMSKYRHLVFFWLKEQTPENIAAARAQLLSLKGKIPGMLSLEAEADTFRTERSCDYCLDTVFDSKESLVAYRTHPVHLPVIAYMKEHCLKSFAADYPLVD